MKQPDRTRTQAVWNISLDIECHHCEEDFNALDTPDFWDGRRLELGETMSEQANSQEVDCPKCGKLIEFYCDY